MFVGGSVGNVWWQAAHHLVYVQFCSTTICCSASITNVLSSPIDHWPNSNFTSRSLKSFFTLVQHVLISPHTTHFFFFFLTQVPEFFFTPHTFFLTQVPEFFFTPHTFFFFLTQGLEFIYFFRFLLSPCHFIYFTVFVDKLLQRYSLLAWTQWDVMH